MATPENTHRWGKDHCTDGLQFNNTGLDQGRKYVVFGCSEAAESKLVKLETSHTVIHPPMVSVHWHFLPFFCNKQGIGLGRNGVQYKCNIGCKISPQAGYTSVCLVLTKYDYYISMPKVCNWKYHRMADLLFDWFGFGQQENVLVIQHISTLSI